MISEINRIVFMWPFFRLDSISVSVLDLESIGFGFEYQSFLLPGFDFLSIFFRQL